MADRLGAFAVPLVPLARPPMELRDLLGLLVEQARPQDVGEQVVVAIPLTPVVERDEEQVPRSSASSVALPPPWPVTASHSGPLSRARIEVCSRKLRTSLGLPLQDLLDEVVDDVAVVAGEAGDEAGDVVPPLHREAASWSAAIQPSVRPSSAATSCAATDRGPSPR